MLNVLLNLTYLRNSKQCQGKKTCVNIIFKKHMATKE